MRSAARKWALVMALGIGTYGAPALADGTGSDLERSAEVNELNEQGAALYASRDYRRAVERFLRAYAIDPDPNLLFNIARCYEKLGDREAAIEKYEEFLSLPGADAVGRNRAHESLQALRIARSQSDKAPDVPSTTSAERSDAASIDVNVPPVPPAPLDGGSASRGSDGMGMWPWLTLGGGALALGTGSVFLALGQKDHNQIMNDPGYQDRSQPLSLTRAQVDELDDDAGQKKLIGAVGLGIGGALLLTSAVLFLVNEQPSEQVQLSLDSSSDGWQFSVAGAF